MCSFFFFWCVIGFHSHEFYFFTFMCFICFAFMRFLFTCMYVSLHSPFRRLISNNVSCFVCNRSFVSRRGNSHPTMTLLLRRCLETSRDSRAITAIPAEQRLCGQAARPNELAVPMLSCCHPNASLLAAFFARLAARTRRGLSLLGRQADRPNATTLVALMPPS